ncbi:Crp/Fnr family transcriptional regulator [Saccharothrix algeriensis]|uniref:CRP-like cAMP-binding protein n=1 Tax=Saccharothrix algeriensis TaxID=173560 RepID=A0A8T8HY52_9PSEU|nr:Crp/Fnr family transcriptional regulator [Saccharothrix algeriensis]MBM7815085.1 CRP-like cAMP-binding protein [Saccharothrix algeriensis]QTR03337.1 Crp/Fnr family transcriptional regulator [Saccharothrix algeriensis]
MVREWPRGSLLGRLPESTRQELLDLGSAVRYAPGREMVRQGATDSYALLLRKGAVKVRTVDEAGRTTLLTVKTAGDIVGEMAALDGNPRSASVIACDAVEADFITRPALLAFLSRHSTVFVELINIGSAHLRWANDRRRELPGPAATRIARVLAELVEAHGREEPTGWVLGFPLTKVELASIAGMKPRTAEKSFGELRRAGVVVTGVRRDVLVPDLERLRSFGVAGRR